MWSYRISIGEMSQNGQPRAEVCYSGRGACKNDPSKCGVVMEGPIPTGKYRIGNAYMHDTLGPYTMNLDPLPGTDTHGRSLFRIHGDSVAHPGDASHGCLIAPRSLREAINNTNDRILEVTA